MGKRGASKPPADAKEGKEAKTSPSSAAPGPPPSINVNHMAEVGAAWERIMGLLVPFLRRQMARLKVKTPVLLKDLITYIIIIIMNSVSNLMVLMTYSK